MRHDKNIIKIGNRPCTLVTEPSRLPRTLIVQPTDSHDREELDKEIAWIEAHSPELFTLAAVHVERWFDELTPWPAPPVFGKTPFGDGAPRTLAYITGTLIPYAAATCCDIGDKEGALQHVIVGGYSLAGLFALWAGFQTPFGAVVGASPSVWYEDFLEYSRRHKPLMANAYLSIGDKESHSRTKIMTTADHCLMTEHDLLKAWGVNTKLEVNPGNHFQDNGVRTAKGMVWTLNAQESLS